MITAVDTNVLLDVFLPDKQHGTRSRMLLQEAYDKGAILICDVVYAELIPLFLNRSLVNRALGEITATVSPIDTDIAFEAGIRWRNYRKAGGPRRRIITDFLIGAHALIKSDLFLTRDRGFYATNFPELQGDWPKD